MRRYGVESQRDCMTVLLLCIQSYVVRLLVRRYGVESQRDCMTVLLLYTVVCREVAGETLWCRVTAGQYDCAVVVYTVVCREVAGETLWCRVTADRRAVSVPCSVFTHFSAAAEAVF